MRTLAQSPKQIGLNHVDPSKPHAFRRRGTFATFAGTTLAATTWVRGFIPLVVALALLASPALAQYGGAPAPVSRFGFVAPPVVGPQPVTPTPSPFAGVPAAVPTGVNPAINPNPGTLVPGANPTQPPNLGNPTPSPLPYPTVLPSTALLPPPAGTEVPAIASPAALAAYGAASQASLLSYQNAGIYAAQVGEGTPYVNSSDAARLYALYNTNAASILTVPNSVVPFESPSPAPAPTEAAPAPIAYGPPPSAPAPSVVYVVVPTPTPTAPEAVAPPAYVPPAPEAAPTATAPTAAAPTPPSTPLAEAPPGGAPAVTPPAPTEAAPVMPRVHPEIILGYPVQEAAPSPTPSPTLTPTPTSETPSRPRAAPLGLVVALLMGGAALGAMIMLLGTRWHRSRLA
jgi:hypothetical protein